MARDRQTLIEVIKPEKQAVRGWSLEIDGVPVPEVSHLRLENPKFGQLEYGAAPGGAYDAWTFHELGGGGSVILPYAKFCGRLYIGVVEQNRPNQGGKVFNVPRGFLSPGEKHFQAAEREFKEEVGLSEPLTVVSLPGDPANSNSTFFDTRGEGEGVKFFAVRVPASYLESEPKHEHLFIKKGAVSADPASKAAKAAEQILGAAFMHWPKVAQLSDMFSVAGAMRLIAFLTESR